MKLSPDMERRHGGYKWTGSEGQAARFHGPLMLPHCLRTRQELGSFKRIALKENLVKIKLPRENKLIYCYLSFMQTAPNVLMLSHFTNIKLIKYENMKA